MLLEKSPRYVRIETSPCSCMALFCGLFFGELVIMFLKYLYQQRVGEPIRKQRSSIMTSLYRDVEYLPLLQIFPRYYVHLYVFFCYFN